MDKQRLAVNIMFFVNGFLYTNLVSRLPRIQDMYELTNGELGILLLVTSLGALIAMPFTGWLIHQHGSKPLSWLAGAAFCVILPFIPMMGYPVLLGVIFFLIGMITGVMDVSMNAQAVYVEEKKGKPIMSSFHAIFSAGMMLGAGAGSLFIQWQFSLFSHFLIISIFSLFLILWGRLHLVNDVQAQAEKGKEGPAFRIPSRSLLGIGFIAFCCMLGEGAMADWSTIYMVKVVQSSNALAPLGLAAFSMAMMLGRFGGDWARAYFGDKRLMVIGGLIAFGGLSVALIWLSPYSAILGLFLTGIGLATLVPIAYSTAGKTSEFSPGVGIAMVTTIGYSGFLFGPPIIGFLADAFGLRLALVFVLGLFLVMIGVSLRRLVGSSVS